MKKLLFLILLPALVFAISTLPDNSKSPQNFWAKDFKARWISQTQANTIDEYFVVKPGDIVNFEAKFKNTGKETWYNSPEDRQVCINIYKDKSIQSSWTGKDQTGLSDFVDSSWLKPYRITCIQELEVTPQSIGTFLMKFKIPENAPIGKWREDITLASGGYWMESDKETADLIGAAHIWIGFNIIGENTPTPKPTIKPTQAPNNITPQMNIKCNSDYLNCSDFSTCSQAQEAYNICISQGVGDIHKLDNDGDGIPCEILCN